MSSAAPDPLRAHAGWTAPVSALLLAAWLGAALYFTVVVTRAAFAVLPTRTLAGAFVGQTLPVLFDSGMLVGAVLVAAALLSPPCAARTASFAGGITIAALTAVARFVILARIARLRLSMPAAIDSLPIDDPSRRAFGQLHALSVGALGLAMLAGIVVAVVLAHSLTVAANE
ncbi:MAG TPA: DUF4149 domain-containing protein [Gemmatimonadaceae bacterium]|jgi:hypothetical protein|nr:DUF4149 domain-containing protein [Gemmatimonadaceae bacterium]